MDNSRTAPRVFQNAEWKVSDFFEKWLRGQCIKPLIQRRIRWKDPRPRKFLEEFLIPIRDSGNPIHVNRTIQQVHHTHVDLYTIFDGNNRTNCILNFVLGPLNCFPEWIPASLSVAGKERLMQTPLTYLQSYPMHLLKWCGPYQGDDPFLQKIVVLQTGLDEPITPELSSQFDEMLSRLGKLSFFDIKIMVKIWDNLSSEQMCKMYESLNTCTSALTKQEMLACSTFHTRYLPTELKEHFEPMVELIRQYYDDMNQSERLQLQEMIADSLSLFEVLAGYQMHLHHLFGWKPKVSNGFIETFAWEVKTNKKKNDDSKTQKEKKEKEPKNLIFELYHEMKLPTNEKSDRMYEFLSMVKQACQRLFDTYHELYESELSFHRVKKISTHATKILLLYLMKHDEDFEDNVRAYLRRVCAYHDLVAELDKETQEHFLKKDALYNPQGKFAHIMIRELLETGTFATGPSTDDLLELTQVLLEQDVRQPQEKRKLWKNNTLKMLCMTAFFNLRVPSMQKQPSTQVDHIVPFSQRHPHSHNTIDICRLGNLTVIPEKANKERGVKPITDEWVKKNGFIYQEYPSEAEYRGMVVANRLENEPGFTEMCERREQMYVEALLRMCD